MISIFLKWTKIVSSPKIRSFIFFVKQTKSRSQTSMEMEMAENEEFYSGGMRGEKSVWEGPSQGEVSN